MSFSFDIVIMLASSRISKSRLEKQLRYCYVIADAYIFILLYLFVYVTFLIKHSYIMFVLNLSSTDEDIRKLLRLSCTCQSEQSSPSQVMPRARCAYLADKITYLMNGSKLAPNRLRISRDEKINLSTRPF